MVPSASATEGSRHPLDVFIGEPLPFDQQRPDIAVSFREVPPWRPRRRMSLQARLRRGGGGGRTYRTKL
jgi:hypothetical protein